MAIYSNKHNKKFITATTLQKLGIVLICVCGVLFINLIFNILSFINSFLLGFFGLFSYALLLSGIVFGSMLCAKKRITVTKKDVFLLLGWLITFVCLINITTTKSFFNYSYGEYLAKVYNYKYSAGGLLISILSYPLNFLTHYVGALVICVICLIVLTALAVERIFAYNSLKKLAQSKMSNLELEDNMLDEEDDDLSDYNDMPVKPKSTGAVDNSIFITDDEEPVDYDEVKAKEKDKSKARRILGLDKEVVEDEIPANALPDNFAKARQMGISKGNYIKTPYNPYTESGSSTSVSASNDGKPNIFYHNDDEFDETDMFAPKETPTIRKTKTDNNNKNLEFLRATKGQYKPLEDDKVDIYDESFTFDDFNANKTSYINNNSKFDNAVKEFEYTKEFMKEEDDFTIADIDSEEVDYKPYTTRKNNYSDYYSGEVNTNVAKPQHYLQVGINEIERKQKKENPKPKSHKKLKYVKPPIDLLNVYENNNVDDELELQQKGRMLEATLESFKIPAKVFSYTKGPAFTRFELQMPPGIPVARVLKYVDDIAMSLETRGKIRMEIPIPGKNAFGVEVPNRSISTVGLRDIVSSKNFQQNKGMLTYSLGKDISGECRVANLEDAPHLLVAGATKSGKSVCLNAMLVSWLYKVSPDDLRIILIDPKQVEFTLYNEIPHLLIPNVITNVEKALCAFNWAIDEMERRYTLFSQLKVRNIEEYNNSTEVTSHINEKLPFIVIVVDELSDLMSQCKKELEEKIIRITQKSRAAGIHLVIATQRPSTDVITGTIKGNLPSRIAFAVASSVDSKVILDSTGAENLLGKGDMLFAPIDMPEASRIQGAFISNKEITNIINFIKENNECDFDSDIEEKMFNRNNNNGGFEVEPSAEVFDPLMVDALRNVIKTNNVSVSKLQRIFSIGFTRAGRIVDQMEAAGFVSPKDSKNNRVIFITQQEFEEKFGEDL